MKNAVFKTHTIDGGSRNRRRDLPSITRWGATSNKNKCWRRPTLNPSLAISGCGNHRKISRIVLCTPRIPGESDHLRPRTHDIFLLLLVCMFENSTAWVFPPT